MESQLDDQLIYSEDSLFNNNGANFLNQCSSETALPELTLSGSDKTFPDNIVSAEGSQLVSNLALLSEPLPLCLPEIESTFSHGLSRSAVHFNSGLYGDRKNGTVDPLHYEGNIMQLELPTLSNSCAVNHQHGFGSQLHHEPLMTTRISENSPVSHSPPTWHFGTHYVMNCNNNNVNDTSQADIQNASYSFERQVRHESSNPALPSPTAFPKKTFYSANGVRPTEVNGPKYSPERKKRGTSKKRKKRGANEPQKPVSAYALFFRDTQANIKSDNPSATFGEISKVVASMWENLSEEAKQVYKQKTETAKRDYLKQLAAYRANLVSKGGLNVAEEDNHAHHLFKPADQRPNPNMSSYYPTFTTTQPMLPKTVVRDSVHQPSYDGGEPFRHDSVEVPNYLSNPASNFLVQNSSESNSSYKENAV